MKNKLLIGSVLFISIALLTVAKSDKVVLNSNSANKRNSLIEVDSK